MVKKSKINKIFIVIVINSLLLCILYQIPIENAKNLCIYKAITGKECFNCGMTRAFLSLLHFDAYSAYKYNHNVIVVFPFTVIVYSYSLLKYINRKEE